MKDNIATVAIARDASWNWIEPFFRRWRERPKDRAEIEELAREKFSPGPHGEWLRRVAAERVGPVEVGDVGASTGLVGAAPSRVEASEADAAEACLEQKVIKPEAGAAEAEPEPEPEQGRWRAKGKVVPGAQRQCAV